MNVWRLITHHHLPEEALAWSRKNGRLAIGWSRVQDINRQGYASPKEITAAIEQCHPETRNAGAGGTNLWDFFFSMRVGDLVILSTGGKRTLVMEVTGDYEFKDKPEDSIGGYTHQRTARILPVDPDRLWRLAGGQPSIGQCIRWPLVKCLKPITLAEKIELTGSTI